MTSWFQSTVTVSVLVVSSAVQVLAAEDNPFARPGASVAVAPPAPGRLDGFELTGVSAFGHSVRVCVMEQDTQRCRWLIVGAPSDGLFAAEYDAQRQAVRIEADGASRWVGLRKAMIATLTLPLREDGSIDLTHAAKTDAQKAREAEQMMTDLLEVGQAARLGRLQSVEVQR